MKTITIPLPSVPLIIGLVTALMVGLFLSPFTLRPANGSVLAGQPAVAASTTVTGCVGNSAQVNPELTLSSRVITPSNILQVASGGACNANETGLTWNQTADLEYVKATTTLPGLVALEIRAYCPSGKQATSGGYLIDLNVNLQANIRVSANSPASNANGNYWFSIIENFNDPGAPNTTANVTVYAICQTVGAGVKPASAGLTGADSAGSSLYEHPISLKP